MKVQSNTIDVAIQNAINITPFSPALYEICDKVDDKFKTAPESVFIGTGGRYYDKKVSFEFDGISYVAEVIVRITSETQQVRNTYTEGYNIYKIA